MKYRSSKGTVINIPDSATPEQIAKIKARADSGYGIDAQKIAKGIGKVKTPGKKDPVATAPDSPGNIDEFLDSILDQYKGLDLSGAPPLASAGDTEAARKSAYDSNYALATQGVEEQRARDLEAQKQELANRGIPLNAGGTDLYSRSIGDVNKRYDTINQNASSQATAAADSAMQAYGNVNTQARQSYIDQQQGQFNSWLDTLGTAGTIQGNKYGIDQATLRDKLNRRMQLRIAKMQNKSSGGSSGGGGSSGSSTIDLGGAPGWEI